MGKAATDTAKEDASLSFRVAFEQTIGRGPLVGIDLEILGLDVNRNVFVRFLLDVDLRPDNPFEHLVASPGKFRFSLWHGIEGL